MKNDKPTNESPLDTTPMGRPSQTHTLDSAKSMKPQCKTKGRLPRTCARTVLLRAFRPSCRAVATTEASRRWSLAWEVAGSDLWEIPDDDNLHLLQFRQMKNRQRSEECEKTK